MRKLKIYLDTSVISHLKQDDAPEKMQDTLTLWDDIKTGKYDVFISDVTLEELAKCRQPKQDIMFAYLNEIEYTELKSNDEIESVADLIIDMGILRPKSYDDCMHIASAIVTGCDYLISWNFKHMVNVKTINGVRVISVLHGYKQVDIIQPTMLIESEDE